MKPLALIIILGLTISSCSSTKHIYVADHLVDCEGVGSQKCMLTKDKIVDNWSNFYDQIEGFTYEEGYEYLLGVKVKKIKNPPADGSSLKYTLVEVYEKKKTEKQITLNNMWKVISMKDIENLKIYPTIQFDENEKKLSGFAGCNNYFGSYDPESRQLDFSKMGMTRKMCPDMTVENAFVNNLRNVSYYKIENKILSFYNANNEVLIACELE
jgi:heat shock protein HslJ